MEKTILKFGDTEIEKQNFTTRSLSLKTVSNISLATKMLKKFHPYVYIFLPKMGVYSRTLMKLNICLF